MRYKLHDVVKEAFPNYVKERGVSWPVRLVLERVFKCRTEALGGYKWECSCGNEKTIYRSCKSRSCSQCGPYELKKFIDSKVGKIFPGDHFHLIFTIPEELNVLWLQNTKVMTNILFRATKKTIFKFCEDEKHMGAVPGVIMALHTWGQNQGLHPHIHSLVTAGGLNKLGQAKYCRKNYLFPVTAAMIYYRYHFLKLIKKNIDLFKNPNEVQNIINQCYKKKWHVFINEKYETGKGVFNYLSKYLRGFSIKDSRIKKVTMNSVTFLYKDYRDGKTKPMTLTLLEFIRRLLLHIPPRNLRTYREAGLYFSDNMDKFLIKTKGIRYLRNREKFYASIVDEKLTDPLKNTDLCSKCNLPFQSVTIFEPATNSARASPKKMILIRKDQSPQLHTSFN